MQVKFWKCFVLFVFISAERCVCCPITDGTCECDSTFRSVACSRMSKLQFKFPAGIPPDTRLLSINKSTLKKIGPNAFRNKKALVNVDLSDNKIDLLSESCFHVIPKLQNLSLANNRLKLIPQTTFASSSNLLKLDLSGNLLLVLVPFNFQGMESLEELYLLRNPTMCIATDSFSGVPNLKRLEMSEMNATLDEAMFTMLTKLKILVIRSFHHVTTIPGNLFRNNTRLEKLYLEELPLTSTLSTDLLNPLSELKALSLRGCRFKRVPVGLLLPVSSSLAALDLSYNPLIGITEFDFKKLQSLKVLKLRNTGLKSIPTNSLDLPLLAALDLSGNKLTTLANSAFGRNHRQLRNVTLGNNPWICDCQLKWLAEGRFVHSGDIPMVCAEPAGMQGYDIRLASYPRGDYFQCEKPTITNFGIGKVFYNDSSTISFNAFCDTIGYPRPEVSWILLSFEVGPGRRRRSMEKPSFLDFIWENFIQSSSKNAGSRHKRDTRINERTCSLCGVPSQDTKNNIRVTSGGMLHVTGLARGFSRGIYTCQAANVYGTVRRSFNITDDSVIEGSRARPSSNNPVLSEYRIIKEKTEKTSQDRYNNYDSPGYVDDSVKKENYYEYYNQWDTQDSMVKRKNSHSVNLRFSSNSDDNSITPSRYTRDLTQSGDIGGCQVVKCYLSNSEDSQNNGGLSVYNRPQDIGAYGQHQNPQKGSVNFADSLTRQTSCCGNGANNIFSYKHYRTIGCSTLIIKCLTSIIGTSGFL